MIRSLLDVFTYISKSTPRIHIWAIVKMSLYHRMMDWAMQKGYKEPYRRALDSWDV